MSDSMLAILLGIIVVACGAAIWAASSNEERLSQWFREHHLRDLMKHRH
ncbi:hypothetical protein [Paraburkholderia terricola]|jgi:hypothetical protein|uniref:Uncharacterized protein YndB with AHSA1/START domain n=1 Tax=Paraburkholderia terricola TaxID=169427 RepID=A0ABU1LWZ9_9BURK|nr:hypothetical protein [Paraburkholderia terricola]MDR6411279.1 uncharacterized protein YndB with AHSA1/START domain [Paraburkholderia terricola]MDR6483481.1 uncharacterized protein YndB with AHSA1/START domain [Paraburkholderia terricola]